MFSGSQKSYISTYFQLCHFDSPVPRPVGLENTFLEHKPCHFHALFFTVEVKCLALSVCVRPKATGAHTDGVNS